MNRVFGQINDHKQFIKSKKYLSLFNFQNTFIISIFKKLCPDNFCYEKSKIENQEILSKQRKKSGKFGKSRDFT